MRRGNDKNTLGVFKVWRYFIFHRFFLQI